MRTSKWNSFSKRERRIWNEGYQEGVKSGKQFKEHELKELIEEKIHEEFHSEKPITGWQALTKLLAKIEWRTC